MPEGGQSMFETVKNQGEKLDNHEERIEVLEKGKQEHEDRLKTLEESSMRLENTILTENKETRTVMREQSDKMFDLVKNAMNYQSAQTTQEHEIKKQEHELKKKEHDLKMQKWNTIATVFLKVSGGLLTLLSSGGALYYLITNYFNN